MGRQKPSVSDRVKEKHLSKIATKYIASILIIIRITILFIYHLYVIEVLFNYSIWLNSNKEL